MLTIKKFFVVTLLQAVVLGVLKVLFFKTVDFSSPGWEFFYWGLMAVLAIFLIRAVGFMNYLEAIFIAMVWFVMDFLVDALVVYPLSGQRIFSSLTLWVGYGFFALFVFALHNKRHLAIRHGVWKDQHHH